MDNSYKNLSLNASIYRINKSLVKEQWIANLITQQKNANAIFKEQREKEKEFKKQQLKDLKSFNKSFMRDIDILFSKNSSSKECAESINKISKIGNINSTLKEYASSRIKRLVKDLFERLIYEGSIHAGSTNNKSKDFFVITKLNECKNFVSANVLNTGVEIMTEIKLNNECTLNSRKEFYANLVKDLQDLNKTSSRSSAIQRIASLAQGGSDVHTCIGAISALSSFLNHSDKVVRSFAAETIVSVVETLDKKLKDLLFWQEIMGVKPNLKLLKKIAKVVTKVTGAIDRKAGNGSISIESSKLTELKSYARGFREIYKRELKKRQKEEKEKIKNPEKTNLLPFNINKLFKSMKEDTLDIEKLFDSNSNDDFNLTSSLCEGDLGLGDDSSIDIQV